MTAQLPLPLVPPSHLPRAYTISRRTPELVKVVNTTFILWFVLPPCTPVIINFFHKFAVRIDGLGIHPFSAFRMVAILSVALAS